MPRRKPNYNFDTHIDPSCLDELLEEDPKPTPVRPNWKTKGAILPPAHPEVTPADEDAGPSSTSNHESDPDAPEIAGEAPRSEFDATGLPASLSSVEFDDEPHLDADTRPLRTLSPSLSELAAQMGDEHHEDPEEYGDDSVLHTESSHDRAYDDAGDSSSQPEVTDEDLFSQKGSVRSSLGSYDGGSESAKGAEYTYDTGEFVPTIRGKSHGPLRTPSDIHSLQMASPAPSVYGAAGVSAPRSAKRAPFPTVSRLGSPSGSTNQSPRNRTPSRFQVKPEAPLVLLHVTLLSPRWMWADVMNSLDSSELSPEVKGLRDSWRMLQDRVGDTVCERGILLGHPQNDYEVLEESLLEALELPLRRRARILECGHYLGPANVTTPKDDEDSDDEDAATQASQKHWCNACKHEIRYDALGSGKVFRVKVYASNGLMKAGAWAACWKEMERIDVELEPIVEPSVHEELIRLAAVLEAQRKAGGPRPVSRSTMGEDRRGRDDARTRDAYSSASGPAPRAESFARPSPGHAAPSASASRRSQSASLPELVFRSVLVFLQDAKNIAIITLAAVALLLALRNAPQKLQFEHAFYDLESIPEIQHVPGVETHDAVVHDQEPTAQPTLLESVVTVAPSVVAQEEGISQETLPSDCVNPLPEPSAGSDDTVPDTVPGTLPDTLLEENSEPSSEAVFDEAADGVSDAASDLDPFSVLEMTGTSPAHIVMIAEPTSPALGMDGSAPHPPQVTETMTEKSVVRVVETVVETQTEFETYRIKVTATATSTETLVVTETQPAATAPADPVRFAEIFRSMWSVKRTEADSDDLEHDDEL